MEAYPLKAERKRRGWSQNKLAEKLGVSTRTVSRWELGLTVPHPYYRDQLCAIFGKEPWELGWSDADKNDVLENTMAPLAQSTAPLAQPTVPDMPEALGSTNAYKPGHLHFLYSTLQNLLLRMSKLARFRPFKRFSSRLLLIPSTILTIVLAIAVVLPTFHMPLPHKLPAHKIIHRGNIYSNIPASYTLTMPSTDLSLQENTQHLRAAFNAVYPQLVNRFALDSSAVPKDMILTRSSDISSSVSIRDTTISVSSDWLQHLPNNIGLLTYELALFVQQYPSGTPTWFSDGMASYARSVYGPADDDSWSLPNAVQPTDSYTQGGGIVARFLSWLEQHTSLDIVDQLNHAIQTKESFSAVFYRLTHHTVDELWSQYQKDPDIALTPEQLYKTVTSRKPLYQSPSLHVQASQTGTWGWSEDLGGLSMSNFAVQADMTILSGDGGGFIFRNNSNEQYRFHIALDGTFDLTNQTNNGPSGFSSAIKEGLHQTNRVTIIAQKHTIYVYVNGQPIMEVDGSSTYVNGQPSDNMNGNSSNYGTVVGVADDSDEPTEVRFDNIQIF